MNQKIFQILVKIIALWSFFGLISSGSVPIITVIFGLLFIPAAAFQLTSMKKFSNNLWTLLTILVFFSCIFWAQAKSMIDAIVFFFIFIEGVKLYTLKKTRDYFHLYVITFFLILAAAILTPSVTFAAVLIGYLFLLIINLIYFNAYCDFDKAQKAASMFGNKISLPDVYEEKSSIFKLVGLITFLMIILSSMFFYFVPRFSTQIFMGFGALKIQRLSGFSEDVNFMNPGTIQSDPSVVMRVKPMIGGNDAKGLSPLYMRGLSLETYTGRRWERGHYSSTEAYNTEMDHAQLTKQFVSGDRRLFQKVILEPRGQNYLFGITYPYRIRFTSPRNVEVDEINGSVKLINPNEIPFAYQVVSLLEPQNKKDPAEMNSDSIQSASRHDLKSLSKTMSDWRTRINSLQIPVGVNTERYKKLADEITQNRTTTYQKALAIQNYFITRYEYSLSGNNEIAPDHLDNFIFNSKKGHCEYFATAMAIILRSMGIPSRLAIGYCTDEWNPMGNYFTVREQHAHTWVEVLIENYGWMSFDPTPPSGIGTARTGLPKFAAFFSALDSMKFFWYRYVIDYSAEDQRLLRGFLKNKTSRMNLSLNAYFNKLFNSLGIKLPKNQTFNLKIIIIFLILFIIFIFLLLALLSELKIFKWKVKLGFKSAKSKNTISIKFFKDILRLLKKYGYAKYPYETPAEFAERVIKKYPALTSLESLISYYYQIRFNDKKINREEENHIFLLFNELKNTLKDIKS